MNLRRFGLRPGGTADWGLPEILIGEAQRKGALTLAETQPSTTTSALISVQRGMAIESTGPGAGCSGVQLPPELWSLILQESLGPASYDHWSDRSQSLRAYSLVSKDFHQLSQAIQYRHIVLPNRSNLSKLLSVLTNRLTTEASDRRVNLGALVRSVRLGNRVSAWQDGSGSAQLGDLLELCPRAEELRLYQLGQIEIAHIAKGQGEH